MNWKLLAPLALLSGCATVAVGPGQIGVLWTATDGTQDRTFTEGAHPVATDDVVSIYDLRTTVHDESLAAIASNGLGIKLDASVLYHVNPK